MLAPKINEIAQTRDMLTTFGGYNHNLVIDDAEFYDTKNTSARLYPCLTQRLPRYKLRDVQNVVAIGAQDYPYWVYINGSSPCFAYYDKTSQEYVSKDIPKLWGLQGEETRTCVNMGAYVCVFPDMWYINLNNPDDNGLMYVPQSFFTVSGTMSLMINDGSSYVDITVTERKTAPTNPADGDWWLDTSDSSLPAYQYSAAQKQWASQIVYIKIPLGTNDDGKTVNELFKTDDWVTLSGFTAGRKWMNSQFRVEYVTSTYILIEANHGIKPSYTIGTPASLGIERRIKAMDYVVCMNNRLWGCSSRNHEIYACRQGDFKNWDSFAGVSVDSYAVTDASSGEYTGACVYNSSVYFFKEDKVIRISGTMPSNFTTSVLDFDGIPKGCGSPVVIDSVMYWMTRKGLVSYTGAQPVYCSDALNLSNRVSKANLFSSGEMLYLNALLYGANDYALYSLDTLKGIWHKEDTLHILCGVEHRGTLIYVNEAMNEICGITLPTAIESWMTPIKESDFEWSFTTVDIGLDLPDAKFCSKLQIRFTGTTGSTVKVFAQYGTERDAWTQVWATIDAFTNTKSVTLPILPHRCDTMRLKFVCTGDVTIYSISKTIERAES